MRFVKPFMYCVVIILYGACVSKEPNYIVPATTTPQHEYNQDIRPDDFYRQLSDAAISLTKDQVTYDPSYFTLDYPNGDVPSNKGVCCDVVIRAYRKLGIDLQKEVHEDMNAHFAVYPHKWGLTHTDKNIDHRRVPNLMKFFERKKASLPITNQSKDYHFGDIVCWDLGKGLTHIGMVVDKIVTEKLDLSSFTILAVAKYWKTVYFDLKSSGIIGIRKRIRLFDLVQEVTFKARLTLSANSFFFIP